jgi:hypothetical protein
MSAFSLTGVDSGVQWNSASPDIREAGLPREMRNPDQRSPKTMDGLDVKSCADGPAVERGMPGWGPARSVRLLGAGSVADEDVRKTDSFESDGVAWVDDNGQTRRARCRGFPSWSCLLVQPPPLTASRRAET